MSDQPVADVGGPRLRLLLCGINPSLRSAETGHHFARPGNRFWPALQLAGITPERLTPARQDELPALGVGITNLCHRPTRRADELSATELLTGAQVLDALVRRWAPRLVGIVGVTAYRVAFAAPKAALGPAAQRIGGRPVWVLPNPSGLNAHHRVEDLGALYAQAWTAAAEL